MAIDDDTPLAVGQGDPNMPWTVERHLVMAAAMLVEREGLPPQTKGRLVEAASAGLAAMEAIIVPNVRRG